MQASQESLNRVDQAIDEFASKSAIPFLRVTLGVVYVWFGALKIFGVSPVADLVGKMAFNVPRDFAVRFMGVWETALGIALLFRLALRATLVLYFLQVVGTFMVFIAHPREAYRKGNPLLLTERGEFIVKNLVLLAAGIAVGSTVRHGQEEVRPSHECEPAASEEVHV